MLKLVGDNPFHGVSHLSQEKAAARGSEIFNPEYAAKLVKISLENGADGFMFSISETTLSLLRILREQHATKNIRLFAITPAAGESARSMGPMGGVEGIIKKAAKQIMTSGDLRAMFLGLKGTLSMNPEALLRSFVHNEISKVKSAVGKQAILDSIMLHEIVTDLALALDLEWVVASYIDFVKNLGTVPGFETRNFAYLIRKFREWNLDIGKVVIATPFNKIGFQMIPSQKDCEETMASIPGSTVIAISVLAAGYLKPFQAIDYVRAHPQLKGVAIAVSKEQHARETFKLFE